MLWAWERPEDLRFVAPEQAGVAFLARTVELSGSEVLDRPRLQPLRFHPGATLMAVVRIESDRAHPPELSCALRSKAAAAIAETAVLPGIGAVQLDYDATVSERAFYRDLLWEVRSRLPASVRLSITALTSWCLDDPWLSGLPIDEAVPMLFRMGPDRAQVLLRLEAGGDFREAACRGSIGLSTDEPVGRLPAGRRLYIFHPARWTPAAAQKILSAARQWR